MVSQVSLERLMPEVFPDTIQLVVDAPHTANLAKHLDTWLAWILPAPGR